MMTEHSCVAQGAQPKAVVQTVRSDTVVTGPSPSGAPMPKAVQLAWSRSSSYL